MMLPISRILLPVDCSDPQIRMLPYAKAIAAKYDAELILLSVARPLYSPTDKWRLPAPMSKEMIAEGRDKLEQFAANELCHIECGAPCKGAIR